MDKEIYLIGFPTDSIVGRKLPNFKEALSLFFYYHKVLQCNIKKSAFSTVNKVEEQWKKVGIPVCATQNSFNKLLAIFKKWKNLQRSFRRKKSPTQIKNEDAFKIKLKGIFDIAHKHALKNISENQRELLRAQRLPDRRGFFDENPQNLNESCDEMMELDDENSDVLSGTCAVTPASQGLPFSQSTISHTISHTSAISDFETELLLSVETPKINIMTPELVAALDRANVSSRNATYILAAALKGVGVDLQNVNLSYSTIHRKRILLREDIAKELKENLKLNDNYVVHWDGKILSDIVGSDSVDRLPVVLTSSGEEQLLGVPKMSSGTGIDQASAVYSTLNDWGVSRYVKAMCFDTAATNTGVHHGAGVELERALGRELIWLPCRHHIFEIILKSVFEVYWPTQSGPNVQFFNRFKVSWDAINKLNYKSGIEDNIVATVLMDQTNDLLVFIENYMQKYHPRNDYREFLELSLIFLGITPKENLSFKRPGAMSHARWMAKAIYCLKIFIFRDEFKLSAREKNGLREVCLFIITNYIKAWFSSPSAILAPNHDLTFLQKLIQYEAVNSKISKAATAKMINHLWYLTDKLAIISLFDDEVEVEVKKKMVVNMKYRKGKKVKARKFEVENDDLNALLDKDISDFVSVDSVSIFKAFDLLYDFVDNDINSWASDESLKECVQFFTKLMVVNDVAERGVALIEQYNKCFTKNEDQLQYLLLVISEYRKKLPNCSKNLLV